MTQLYLNVQNVWSPVGGSLHSYVYEAQKLKAFYPKSQREFIITVCLCVLSVIVVSYFMVYLYKCMCSRNYSRWRHRWSRHHFRDRRQRSKGAYYKQIKESVPILLKGHNQVREHRLKERERDREREREAPTYAFEYLF